MLNKYSKKLSLKFSYSFYSHYLTSLNTDHVVHTCLVLQLNFFSPLPARPFHYPSPFIALHLREAMNNFQEAGEGTMKHKDEKRNS